MKSMLVVIALVLGLPALAEAPAPLVSEWTLKNANVAPGWAPETFDCAKSLRMSDSGDRLEFANADPDVNARPVLYPTFTGINAGVSCTPFEAGSKVHTCTKTDRPLNADVWALNQVICKTEDAECKAADVRWTVTANPAELVVRRDCRNCPLAVMTGQCVYAFVKGDVRHLPGQRVGEREGPHDDDMPMPMGKPPGH
jgi:hypothetical protein